MRVIIIDDEESIRFLIYNFLLNYSSDLHIVGVAENGEKGIELCGQLHPDLIISDIKMPRMSGLDLIRKLREMDVECDCIFISAYTEFAYVQEAIRNGAAGYLLKPIQKEELYELVSGLLDKWKKREKAKKKVELLKNEIKKLKKDRQIDSEGMIKMDQYSKPIQIVLNFIEENYHQDISLETAATEVFMNKNYLSGLFRRETGVGFAKYLTDYRMKKAKILLRETELNISEIADMTGFATANYFVRVFRKQENCTPGEYRLQKEKD